MLDAARTLFLEEWLISVLVLLALVGLGSGLWYLAAARRKRPKPSTSAMESAGVALTPLDLIEPAPQRGQRDISRLQKAVEVLRQAPVSPKPPGPFAEPDEETRKMVMKGLQGLDAFGLTFAKMRVFNDPNASLQHISQAITSDIVFSSKVLKTANSPYFGMQGQVSSLHHAVLILGLNNLKTLYFQDHFKMLGSETGPLAQIRNAVWKHSISTAICASHICIAFPQVDAETAFTLGLIHDLGKLVLADMTQQLRKRDKTIPAYSLDWDLEKEYAQLGVNHAWIGKVAAEQWKLPGETAEVIGAHHTLDLGTEPPPSVSAEAQLQTLVVADFLAYALLKGNALEHPLPESIARVIGDGERLIRILADPQIIDELKLAKVVH